MLHIYTRMDSIPDGYKYIKDAEAAFGFSNLVDNEFTRYVLKEVEGGSYAHPDRFYDKFNRPIYKTFLSTGSKALLAAHYKCNENIVVNMNELGEYDNDAVTKLTEAHIFWTPGLWVRSNIEDPVEVDGVVYDEWFEAQMAMRG